MSVYRTRDVSINLMACGSTASAPNVLNFELLSSPVFVRLPAGLTDVIGLAGRDIPYD